MGAAEKEAEVPIRADVGTVELRTVVSSSWDFMCFQGWVVSKHYGAKI